MIEDLRIPAGMDPTGLLMTAVTHFIAPALDPWGLVARYTGALASGSYLVLSQVTDEKTPPASVRRAEEMYASSGENLFFQSRGGSRWSYCGVARCP